MKPALFIPLLLLTCTGAAPALDGVTTTHRLAAPDADPAAVLATAGALRLRRAIVRDALLLAAARPWAGVETHGNPKAVALRQLGEYRYDDDEVIAVLLRDLAYREEHPHVIEEVVKGTWHLYPAANALVRIGLPALPAVLAHAARDGTPDIEVALAARILCGVVGREGVQQAAADQGQRLQAAVAKGLAGKWWQLPDPVDPPAAGVPRPALPVDERLAWLAEDGTGKAIETFLAKDLPRLLATGKAKDLHDRLAATRAQWADGPMAEELGRLQELAVFEAAVAGERKGRL